MKTIFVIIIIFWSGFVYAGTNTQVVDLDGRAFEGDTIRFDDNNQVILSSKGVTPTSFACDNLAGISFSSVITTSALKPEQPYFRITLVNRDVLYGTISDTAKNGFAVYNNNIGKIPLNFEEISSIERIEDNEPLSLKIINEVKRTEREDTIFLISGDMDSGIVIALTSENVSIRSTLYNKDRTYKISDVRAVNLFSFPAVPEKTVKDKLEAIVYLVDNSRLSGVINNKFNGSPLIQSIRLEQNKSGYQISIMVISFICFKNDRCIYLSDFEPADVREYVAPDDKAEVFLWHYQKDRGLFSPKPISLPGRKYFKGLAVHANCELTYKLDGSYRKLFATIGLTNESTAGQFEDLSGSVRFTVYLDGKKAFESEVFKRDGSAQDISLDIKGAKEIRLVASDAGDGYIFDRAAWALARLVR